MPDVVWNRTPLRGLAWTLAAAAALALAGCGGGETADAAGAAEAEAAPAAELTPAPEPPVQELTMVYAELQTSMGPIVLELDKEKAPISVANFVNYAEKDAYDGTIFHRVIDGFMVQGGGLEADLDKRPTEAPIENEWQNGLSNTRGTVAMARLGNEPDSATNQFFINVADNLFLDTPRDGAGYAVFGRVVDGMDIVDQMKGVRTTTRGAMRDVPVDPITIEDVRVLDNAEAAKYAGRAN